MTGGEAFDRAMAKVQWWLGLGSYAGDIRDQDDVLKDLESRDILYPGESTNLIQKKFQEITHLYKSKPNI